MKLAHKTPCGECPWRRDHPAGWLGGYSADDFINQVQHDGPPLPCHKTIPGDGTEARAMCAGALIFMKISVKSAQHPDYGDAFEQVERDPAVFSWPHEFRHHHSEAGHEEWVRKIMNRAAANLSKGS